MSASDGSEAAPLEDDTPHNGGGDGGDDEDYDEEGEGEGEGGEDNVEEQCKGMYNSREVQDQIFEELELPDEVCQEVQGTWQAFLKSAESREAAGESIYAALFDAAPSLQS
eukprot:CAMPEP_0195111910 /NCGR_PEP_ID=MMETSP0448-20130528/97583_1 /TAXON_ID=66468 /ORGANISM="Heterocapsa triquestra, Strain CCMP 448" /LENGTH=110 /DNA_ID=CAMNT_0040148729 /DNA_START=18 /DNA_END=347 /DNA_ORIENTATION=+